MQFGLQLEGKLDLWSVGRLPAGRPRQQGE
jgi:hypothetical protein